eukprot:Lithocolla_globosa_v1_NODE_96_length_6498_cov_20.614310.p5 type:complete len:199 gc:universal NODE_96_length_6498_cov_20.614310:3049-2453(-)
MTCLSLVYLEQVKKVGPVSVSLVLFATLPKVECDATAMPRETSALPLPFLGRYQEKDVNVLYHQEGLLAFGDRLVVHCHPHRITCDFLEAMCLRLRERFESNCPEGETNPIQDHHQKDQNWLRTRLVRPSCLGGLVHIHRFLDIHHLMNQNHFPLPEGQVYSFLARAACCGVRLPCFSNRFSLSGFLLLGVPDIYYSQ